MDPKQFQPGMSLSELFLSCTGESRNAGWRSTDMPCFTWVNTAFGNVKIALVGTYHAFNFSKFAHRYLAEYHYRFNWRFDLKAIRHTCCAPPQQLARELRLGFGRLNICANHVNLCTSKVNRRFV